MVKRLLGFVAAFCVTLAIIAIVPPPQRAAAQFVDQGTWGGNSGGSANAQTITIGNYAAHKSGVILRFNPTFTNTGPTQINVSGLGLINVMRPSSIGLVAFSGGEFLANEPTSVMYNGSVYVLASNVDMTPIGKTIEFRGTSAPRGSLIEDGSCVSQTTYAALFGVIGTNYGSCSAGLFALPDSRGSLFAALDNQGSNGAANRITSGGSSCTATAVGTRCGAQNQTLTAPQLPSSIPYNEPNSGLGHTHPIAGDPNGTTGLRVSGGAEGYASGSHAEELVTAAIIVGNAVTGITINPSGGQSHPILPPILTGIRAIKY